MYHFLKLHGQVVYGMRNVLRIARKPETKRPLGTTKCRWGKCWISWPTMRLSVSQERHCYMELLCSTSYDVL